MEEEPQWVERLRRQLDEGADGGLVLTNSRVVERAIAGWWDIAGVVIAEDSAWQPPEWSGLELVRRPRGTMAEWLGRETEVLALSQVPDETADVSGLMAELEADAVVVVCPRLDDSRSVGEVVRNAAALGAKAVIFGNEGGSPFEPEALEIAEEALFRLPVRVADAGQILRCLKAGGFQLVGAGGDQRHWPDPEGRLALVMGGGGSLGSFWTHACDARVKVPPEMDVASSLAVMLWEFGQRRADQSSE